MNTQTPTEKRCLQCGEAEPGEAFTSIREHGRWVSYAELRERCNEQYLRERKARWQYYRRTRVLIKVERLVKSALPIEVDITYV